MDRANLLVHHFLRNSAERRPESIAVIHGRERATYGDIESASNRIAQALVRSGIRPGDRVGLLAVNSVLYVQAYYGILKAGSVAVAISSEADARTIRDTLGDCGTRGLIAGENFGPPVEKALPGLPEMRIVLAPAGHLPGELPAHLAAVALEDAMEAGPATPPDVARIDADCAAIIYTSGSTGRPRGAVLTHLNIASNTRSIVRYLDLSHEDRVLVVLPFHYVYGKSLLNTHFFAGGSVILENRFLFPKLVLEAMEQEEATGFSGVPSTYAILLNRTDLARRQFPRLRYVTQAGGAMAPDLIRRLMDALPGKRIFIMYGATEASARLAYLPPEDLPAKIGSVGRAIPNVELRVLRDDGSEAAPGEIGEVVARGSNIMLGYWGDPEETSRVLDAAGFHTGDLGWFDAEGYLRIAGRKREMIKTGAHRIHPKEIEEALLEHAAVSEAAVVGIPDEVMGAVIRAVLVLRDGRSVTGTEIQAFCRERLPLYKVPKVVEFRTELPKSPAGKVLKSAL